MAYDTTSVSVERSQGEIRKLLSRYGAERFSFHEGLGEDARQWVALEFVHERHLVRVAVPLKSPDEAKLKGKARRAYSKTLAEITSEAHTQEARRIWRVVYFSLKSRMEAVAEGVETFEQAFLPHIVDPASGNTIWQRVRPSIERGTFQIGGAGFPELTAGAPA